MKGLHAASRKRTHEHTGVIMDTETRQVCSLNPSCEQIGTLCGQLLSRCLPLRAQRAIGAL